MHGGEIGRVETADGYSTDDVIWIVLRITNTSSTKKLDYVCSCAPGRTNRAVIRDNLGNVYRPFVFGASNVRGRTDSATLYPGKSISDVLVFEKPVSKATQFVINIPDMPQLIYMRDKFSSGSQTAALLP